MKKWPLFFAGYFCLCLLAACAASGTGDPAPVEPDPDGPAAIWIGRVVTEEDGDLLLAGQDGGAGDIYTLTVAGQDIEAGALVEVAYDGTVLESYPGQFGGDVKLTVRPEGFDDRCDLYLDVLNDLWEVDPGLNSDDLTYVGVDLSQTSLPESERSAVAWAFAQEHGAELVEGTWDDLAAQGYFADEPIGDGEARFWEWEDGCLFSIAEQETAGVFSLNTAAFDAQKWRSGLGAYFFVDCTSVQSADGHWDGYQVGSEAIS